MSVWSKHKRKIEAWLPPVVGAIVLLCCHRFVAWYLHSQGDGALLVTVYAFTGLPALGGCAVSVWTPKLPVWKGIVLFCFIFCLYVGFVATKEQAARLQKSNEDASRQSAEYTQNLVELRSEVKGIRETIASVGAPSGAPWVGVLARLDKIDDDIGGSLRAAAPTPAAARPAPPPPNSTAESAPTLSVALAQVTSSVDNLNRQWPNAINGAFLNLGRGGYWRSGPSPEAPSPEAKNAVAVRLKGIDDSFTTSWARVQPEVQRVHTLAIDHLSRPGQGQLSPPQLQEDFEQFQSAMISAAQPLSIKQINDNKVDKSEYERFNPLVVYLDNLGRKLSDYDNHNTP